jgi:hypothetical protein
VRNPRGFCPPSNKRNSRVNNNQLNLKHMRQFVEQLIEDTRARDEHGEVITSITGRIWSIILFLAVSVLTLMAVTGILFMIGGLIFGYVDTAGVSFGIYG